MNSLKFLVNHLCNMCRTVQDGKAGTDAGAEALNVTALATELKHLIHSFDLLYSVCSV
jgi:hypothetical protein